MGQFSWMASDTGEQIACNQPKGFQTVKMVYKENGEVKTVAEDDYEGYGVFGEIDYYVALLWTNGIEANEKDREVGIDMYFGERALFYPQLFLHQVPNFDNIDFSIRPEDDYHQGYLSEEVEEDDFDYDEYYRCDEDDDD